MPSHRHRGLSLMPWSASWWGPGRMLRLVDDLTRGTLPVESEAQVWVPSVEMHQMENELVMNVELPGVKKEDLEVQVTGDSITFKGQRQSAEEACPEGNICCSEFCYGSFERTIAWPVEVKAEEAKSKLQDGILEVRAPLHETAKLRIPKRIEIQ